MQYFQQAPTGNRYKTLLTKKRPELDFCSDKNWLVQSVVGMGDNENFVYDYCEVRIS